MFIVCVHVLDILVGFKDIIVNKTRLTFCSSGGRDTELAESNSQSTSELNNSIFIKARICYFYFMVHSLGLFLKQATGILG